jgi:hypothetical protein
VQIVRRFLRDVDVRAQIALGVTQLRLIIDRVLQPGGAAKGSAV